MRFTELMDALPAELIFDRLDMNDLRSLSHASKGFHKTPEIRQRITKMVLHIPSPIKWGTLLPAHRATVSGPADATMWYAMDWAQALVRSFPWPKTECLELRADSFSYEATFMEDNNVSLSYVCGSLPYVWAAIRAVTAAQGDTLKRLIIADSPLQPFPEPFPTDWLSHVCTSAPRGLERLELRVMLTDDGDILPLQHLQQLRHLTIQRTQHNDVPVLEGVCDVLRSCTHLQSLVLPHAYLLGMVSRAQPSSELLAESDVCCPSVTELKMVGLVADMLPDLGWLLSNVFPGVRQLDIGCLQLVNYYAVVNGEEDVMLQRIASGAAELLAGGRARIVDDEGRVKLSGVDFLSYANERLHGPEHEPMYERALEAFLGGWLRGGAEPHRASALRALHLTNIRLGGRILSTLARFVPDIRELCLDNENSYHSDPNIILLTEIIRAFPLLSNVTMASYLPTMSAMRSAAQIAFQFVSSARRHVVLRLEGHRNPLRNEVCDKVKAEMMSAIDQVRESLEAIYPGPEGTGMWGRGLEVEVVPARTSAFIDVRGSQFFA